MGRFYFAYGSNMNPERMRTRGLAVIRECSGFLEHKQLVFNKRASDAPHRAYANIAHSPYARVEGVLYELANSAEIEKMDPFEGAPWRYSRDVFWVVTPSGLVAAWVYVANKAMLAADLKPARWYLEHLLKGRPYLSEDYYQWLTQIACLEHESLDHHGGLLVKQGGLVHVRGEE